MKVNVSVVQDSPVFFDKEKTLEKVATITRLHAHSSDLILFPESFVPGYPRGFDFGTRVGNRSDEGRKLYRTYYDNSIDLSGSDRSQLEKLAKETNCYLILGATERVATHDSLYCSMIYISPTNGLLGVHRKIKPTGQERVIWAESDGSTLVTYDTAIGRLGGLICWENYMPLARQAMYDKKVEFYLAPTADVRETWTPTMQHIALEGRCFVLSCNQYVTRSMYPENYQKLLSPEEKELSAGGSVIISTKGKILAGPLVGESGVLKATLDTNEIKESKLDFDVSGHYARPDIFKLQVIGQPEIRKDKTTGKK